MLPFWMDPVATIRTRDRRFPRRNLSGHLHSFDRQMFLKKSCKSREAESYQRYHCSTLDLSRKL